ncbi:MAG: hypothetical protein JST90_17715 [Bacteroidetes bacterium]|nr:hypothetical protein [Bacteroidota bacterium]
MEHNLPIIHGSLIFIDMAVAADGGSMFWRCKDALGHEITFYLPQYRMQGNHKPQWIPGRLHVNNCPIPLRSEEERYIISLLRQNDILCDIADRVESEEYWSIATYGYKKPEKPQPRPFWTIRDSDIEEK